ncbi:MAG: regulatory protein RecX [Bacteroidota bacterium]|nr:regulatory protein RecX [Bacteroidota bacterium]MDP4206762.1 regulatory protein RecX [Bacteroidota bacterium]
MLSNQALNKAAELCSKSERCSWEISRKLHDWGLSDEQSDHIIGQLQKEKFIDDNRYAHFFARDKFRFNKWGKIKIAYELRMRNIPNELIQSVLNEINNDSYLETLQDLLKAKASGLKAKDQWDKRSKLMRFAQGRGFEADVTLKVIENYI